MQAFIGFLLLVAILYGILRFKIWTRNRKELNQMRRARRFNAQLNAEEALREP